MTLMEQLKEIPNVDPNDPGSWPTVLYAIVAFGLFIAVIGGGYWQLIIKDLSVKLASAEATERTLWDEFELKQRRAANLDALVQQLEDMDRQLGGMLRQLPSEAEIDSLVIDISQAALGAGLEQELFQPQSEVPREFYAEKPIRMRLTGDYHRFGSFVSAVAALPRIVTIHDIQISQDGDQLELSVVAKTYRYLDDDSE
jgi:type IV pilus assembly protein PilO